MKYVVKSNFDNGKSYKVGDEYAGSDAESLLDKGLLVKSDSPEGKRLAVEAEISGKAPEAPAEGKDESQGDETGSSESAPEKTAAKKATKAKSPKK